MGLWNFRRLEDGSNANGRNHLDNNNGQLVGITLANAKTLCIMKSYNNLWPELCSYDNLFLAYKKARKHKTTKYYVIEFEKNLKENLLLLRTELLLHAYRPKPLVNFIVRDPKTRKISKSDFRDRIIHHALCNIIEPIFDKTFIHDSYANRINKGTLKALQRFDYFKKKVSKNDTVSCYVLKADIKKYFENINHEILLNIIKRKIKDNKVLWLIKLIINNHLEISKCKKGMPLGNLTSQFFANVYLNELDYFVKHDLKGEYYTLNIRVSKTKPRVISIPMKKSTQLLAKWLEQFKKPNMEAFVFDMGYQNVRKMLNRLGKKAINKKVHPHLFRHSSMTRYANLLKHYQFAKRYGLALNSDVVSRYIDLSGIDEEETANIVKATRELEMDKHIKELELKNNILQEQMASVLKHIQGSGKEKEVLGRARLR